MFWRNRNISAVWNMSLKLFWYSEVFASEYQKSRKDMLFYECVLKHSLSNTFYCKNILWNITKLFHAHLKQTLPDIFHELRMRKIQRYNIDSQWWYNTNPLKTGYCHDKVNPLFSVTREFIFRYFQEILKQTLQE